MIVKQNEPLKYDSTAMRSTPVEAHKASGIPLSLLSELHCPYCGSAINVAVRLPERSRLDSIDYGILQCACNLYPVVAGIPIIQHVDGLQSIVTFVRAGDQRRALLQAMNVFRVKWAHRTKWHQLKYYVDCRKLISSSDLYFQDAVNLVRRPKVFSDYLFHRYANPSFLAAIGPLHLLGTLEDVRGHGTTSSNNPIRVLDLACGAGHTSFLMRHLFPELSVYSVDHDFVSLYLAKRYLAPNSTYLCLDAEVPSPFPDAYFDALFCLDAFHYFRSKRAIVAELNRVSKQYALWLFPHLHNALQQNLVAGIPLSPDMYLECFSSALPKIFDETEIVNGLSKRHELNLSLNLSASDLNNSQTLTLIGGPEDLWRVHDSFPTSFCEKRSSLTINPIYRPISLDDTAKRELTWPNDVMRRECLGAEAILPRSCQLSKAELQDLTNGSSKSDREQLVELVANFVLVPLPPHYSHATFV